MSIIHDFIRVAADGVGKRVGNVVQTDPDADEIHIQKTVTADPEDATDSGLQRVTDGHAHTQQRAEVTDDATATWTSATAEDTALTIAVSGYAVAALSIAESGTFSSGQIAFEGSADGGTSWWILEGVQPFSSALDYAYGAGSFPDGAVYFWFGVTGLTDVRFRLSSALVGGTSIALKARASAGAIPYTQARVFASDGAIHGLGFTSDVEATGNGTLIAITKRLRTLLSGGLPAALGAGGGLKVDGSGTALPVSGTVTINAIPAGTNNIGDVDVLTVPADPFGANADAAIAAGATGSLSAKLRAISRDLVANIVLAAGANIIGKVGIDQTTPGTTNLVAAGQSGTWTVQPGNTANTTAWKVDGSAVTQPVSGTFWQATQPVSAASLPLPTGAATAAKQPALGTAGSPSADVISVQGVASGTPQPVTEQRAATSSLTNVNDTNSNVTLLASNANRLGATIHNDSTAVLYVKLGATASATSFTVKMSAGSYYEVPFNYTGIIDGIWASDASGAARITELSA